MEPHILRVLCTELGRMRIRPGTGNLCVGTYSEYLCVMGEKKRLGGRSGRGGGIPGALLGIQFLQHAQYSKTPAMDG